MWSLRQTTSNLIRPLVSMVALIGFSVGSVVAVPLIADSDSFFASQVHAAPAPPADSKNLQFPEIKAQDPCNKGQCLIDKYVNPGIKLFSALVAIGVVLSIMYGGFEISSSGNNPQKVASGQGRIRTAIFVLVGYFVFYAFLNWVIPGGTGAI